MPLPCSVGGQAEWGFEPCLVEGVPVRGRGLDLMIFKVPPNLILLGEIL